MNLSLIPHVRMEDLVSNSLLVGWIDITIDDIRTDRCRETDRELRVQPKCQSEPVCPRHLSLITISFADDTLQNQFRRCDSCTRTRPLRSRLLLGKCHDSDDSAITRRGLACSFRLGRLRWHASLLHQGGRRSWRRSDFLAFPRSRHRGDDP